MMTNISQFIVVLIIGLAVTTVSATTRIRVAFKKGKKTINTETGCEYVNGGWGWVAD